MSSQPQVRVLMLVQNASYPMDPRVRKEACALGNAGYSVVVVSPAEAEQKFHEVIGAADVYRFPAPSGGRSALGYAYEYVYSVAAMFFLTVWIYLRHGFDVIHAANPPDVLAVIAVPYKWFGIRFVFDHHDLAPEMYVARFPDSSRRWVYNVLIWCEKLSCKLADHVLATNESYKQIEMQRGAKPASCITIVRNGPELHSRDPAEPQPSLRSRAATIIGFAGVTGIQDGVDYLLRAFRHLVNTLERQDVLCLIVGDGAAMPALKQQAEASGIAKHVVFTGWIRNSQQFESYIATADICVDPSPSNPYNDRCTAIKIMEYMAAAKPIVAFDLPEHRATAASSAIFVRPNDELEFALAIANLIDNPGLRHDMGRIGRRRIEESFEWRYSAARLIEAYQSLLSPRAK